MITELKISQLGTKSSFAGIGTSRTTEKECRQLSLISLCMVLSGHRVLSGCAHCSDHAFEFGAKVAYDFIHSRDDSDLPKDYTKVFTGFLPWQGFNLRPNTSEYPKLDLTNALHLTAKYHPVFDKLTDPIKRLMARNAMQVLGQELNSKVSCIICSTSDGANAANKISSKTGGTGQALRIAHDYGVPIYNNQNPEDKTRLSTWVESFCDKFTLVHGQDPRAILDEALANFKPATPMVNGDLISMLKNDEIDLIIHGCNIQNVKGSGFAEILFKAFPEARKADHATIKGDKKKMGTVSVAEFEINGKRKVILNAYTQERWGRDPDVAYIDYRKFRKALKELQNYKSLRIGMPKIGSGLAQGHWLSLANIIDDACQNLNAVIVNFTPPAKTKKR